jgi:hypothetical protein
MSTERIENWLQDIRLLNEERFVLLDRVRKLVRAVDPKISEEFKYGGILFSAGAPFCGLFSYAPHVGLEFGRGADLADPHQVLEGDGKKRRHIKLVGPQDLFKKNIKAYVTAAFLATASASIQAPGAAAKRPRPTRS